MPSNRAVPPRSEAIGRSAATAPKNESPTTPAATDIVLTRGAEENRPSEELTFQPFGITHLRRDVFFAFNQVKSSGVGLSFQFGVKAFLSLDVPLCPNRSVVFDLVLHHRVKDDGYFVGSRRL